MAGLTTRRATPGDVDTIAALTAAYRKDLAGWAPQFWRPAEDADTLHRAWIEALVSGDVADGPVVQVLGPDETVAGCAFLTRQRHHWVVDDLVVAPKIGWTRLGAKLFASVTVRPAITTVPVEDAARSSAAERSGLTRVSSYWLRRSEPGPTDVEPIAPRTEIPAAPMHTFDAPLDARSEGGLAFAASGGFVVASASIPAPPVYDPGGTVCVADRVVGTNRGPLLHALSGAAHDRGDVMTIVVCDVNDSELAALLVASGYHRVVDVFSWQAA